MHHLVCLSVEAQWNSLEQKGYKEIKHERAKKVE
jgi:hypothetical protein